MSSPSSTTPPHVFANIGGDRTITVQVPPGWMPSETVSASLQAVEQRQVTALLEMIGLAAYTYLDEEFRHIKPILIPFEQGTGDQCIIVTFVSRDGAYGSLYMTMDRIKGIIRDRVPGYELPNILAYHYNISRSDMEGTRNS